MSALFGLKVRIEPSPRCCSQPTIAIVEPSDKWAADLKCASCGKRRGWLSTTTADFLETIVGKWGAPRDPIVLRREHYQASSL
jgi:hypothetical protein